MSRRPSARFAAGCQHCSTYEQSEQFQPVVDFYVEHAGDYGHDVEWLWGDTLTALDIELDVVEDAAGRPTVANLEALVHRLASLFDSAPLPAALVLEACVSAGAAKAPVEQQLATIAATSEAVEIAFLESSS
jgi:hypothetical protein